MFCDNFFLAADTAWNVIFCDGPFGITETSVPFKNLMKALQS